ncbi:Uncharacterized protein APZ42_021227 [Daphnia magna]|uniref:Uncharacterized protein n=1 Tax=Daphnia magna TaxID=35525 RepID=A0A162CAW1_9CRUS|nr:Uncharacterized protein APZ42_021227 [Daphnia magna]
MTYRGLVLLGPHQFIDIVFDA